MEKQLKKLSPVSWKQVEITGGFWQERMKINEEVTLPAEYEQCRVTGRIDSIRCIYDREADSDLEYTETIDGRIVSNEGKAIKRPHHYWDSDVAKWIEAQSYSLLRRPDPDMEQIIDGIILDFEKEQYEDGYLNTYFTVVEPGKRWTNVHVMHELYCAGHLIEAAIAYYEATGKDRFLKMVIRYADYIDTVFGPQEGKIHGYPGHQEIELALVKLYRLTDNQRYLLLAGYFLDERGKQPYFFEQEALQNGRDPEEGGPKGILGKSFLPQGPYALFQAHLPIREQKSAEGHAVRVMYMGCGAADVAVETGDTALLEAGKILWDSVTEKKMAVTGGVGAQEGCERFNFDYHLPNEEAYNETCASVGLVMWACRMLQAFPDSRYGDVMERALYNGVISGVSLKGDRFFYANHLASHPGMYEDWIFKNPRMLPKRQSWFPVSCCPMNLARLTESIGGYAYSTSADTFYVHLFLDSRVEVKEGREHFRLRQQTEYPKSGRIIFRVEGNENLRWKLAVRIPDWCRQAVIKAGGQKRELKAWLNNGYAVLPARLLEADEVELELGLEPLLLESHPSVRMNCGKAALQYGPLVYCLEEEDNGKDLQELKIEPDSLQAVWRPDLLNGIHVLHGLAKRRRQKNWEHRLYAPAEAQYEEVPFQAIPYYAWSNRSEGEMTVWMQYCRK